MDFVRKAGLEPAHQLRYYPLKIACIPNFTTSAKLSGKNRIEGSENQPKVKDR